MRESECPYSMSVPLTESSPAWEDMLADFESQLMPILKSNQIVQDYTLLKGVLQFMYSRCNKVVHETLLNSDANVDSLAVFLDRLWEKIEYPVFKWFQAWRQSIVPKTRTETPRYVEFRKMNSKLSKFFKSVHKFHYHIIEELLQRYDFKYTVPSILLSQLRVKQETSNVEKVVLDINTPFTVSIVVTLHRCLLYLGSAQRYRSLCEKISDKYQVQDFEKACKYFDMAITILPSMGETYLQKALIFIKIDKYSSAVYFLIRASLARIPSYTARANLKTMLFDSDGSFHTKFNQLLSHIQDLDTNRTRFVNSEIIENYFIALLGVHLSPIAWQNPHSPDQLANGINIKHLKNSLYEKMANKYSSNMNYIFQNVVTIIGCYDILLLVHNSKTNIRNVTLDMLNTQQVNFLQFTFEYLSNILENIIIVGWEKNLTKIEYLGIVRVIECWIKSNRGILQFSHRHLQFCNAMGNLLNTIFRNDAIDTTEWSSHRPSRGYFFQEDVLLRDFSCINYTLTDFNDESVFTSPNNADKIIGIVQGDDKLFAMDESKLRLQAIVHSGMKFLAKNSCHVKWNVQTQQFSMGKKVAIAGTKSKTPAVKKMEVKKEIVIKREKKQTERKNESPVWGYSGSSVPAAPTTFDIKPSMTLTDKTHPKVEPQPQYTPQPVYYTAPQPMNNNAFAQPNMQQQTYAPQMMYPAQNMYQPNANTNPVNWAYMTQQPVPFLYPNSSAVPFGQQFHPGAAPLNTQNSYYFHQQPPIAPPQTRQ